MRAGGSKILGRDLLEPKSRPGGVPALPGYRRATLVVDASMAKIALGPTQLTAKQFKGVGGCEGRALVRIQAGLFV